ncbi:MAG TPA: hypothetical protein VFT91_09065 [Dehalococcoidia bacterium]|nr:hypothetical protein [Dehalococcoidia bacterium]
MEIMAELDTLKGKVKRGIVGAVNDTGQLSALVRLLEDVERDASILAQLQRNVDGYHSRLATVLNGSGATAQAPSLDFTGSKKQLGNSARFAFAHAHGLTQVKGVVYANASSSMFGIAMASEDKRGNKWWLGLPDAQFSSVVLLCQDGNALLEFILPATSLATVWRKLSRSAGQVKFNVKRENLKYSLMVPEDGPFDITRFLGNYSPLEN